MLGTTRRERIVYEAADDYVARAASLADPAARLELKESTKRKIAAIWEQAREGQAGPVIRVRLPDPPQELLDRGAIELAKARAHFGDATLEGTPFTFAAYKLDPVKEALNATFEFKCAYCESFFGATQPLDVEHYRPKSGVLVGDGADLGRLLLARGALGEPAPVVHRLQPAPAAGAARRHDPDARQGEPVPARVRDEARRRRRTRRATRRGS